MRGNQLLILFASVTSTLILLVAGVYFLLNSNTTGTPAGMMDGFPTTTNNGIIALVLISTAIIIPIAIVLYFVYYTKEKTEKATIETPSNFDPALIEKSLSTCSEKVATKAENPKPFDVFLCYKKSSGKDFADHLKTGLEELGLHTFEDCKDIPQTVNTQEGWASFRDNALEQSRYFVLIMTPGFNLSSEVVKEITLARKQTNKTFIFFRLRSMKRNIVVNLENESFDIGKLEQVSFESKEELLRLANNILLNAKVP